MALPVGDHQQLHASSSCHGEQLLKFVATLDEILTHVESKKDAMEILCQETRKLLKPLPKWFDPVKRESEMNEVTSEKKEEKKSDPHGAVLPPSESELTELNLIDKALKKAQKTWEKHQHPTIEDVSSCKEVIYDDSVKSQSKSESGSDCEEFTSAADVLRSDANIGIISDKKLSRALSNVRVSQMKSAYKKAPNKTYAHEQKKVSLSSRTTKPPTKSSFQQSSQTSDPTLRNLTLPKDGKSHSSSKSLSRNPNPSKEDETLTLPKDGKSRSSSKSLSRNPNPSKEDEVYSKMTLLNTNNSSSSSRMTNTQNKFGVTRSEENRKKIGLKFNTNTNVNCDTLYVIPPSIKRLCQENHRLRKTVGKMKESAKNGESFLRLWETKMKKTPNIEARMFTQKYENLYKLLQSLKLPSLSDSSSPEEILGAKISMEYILTSMYDLNQETETLLRKAKTNSTSAAIPQTRQTPIIVPNEIWLPPDLLNSRFHHDLKESSARLHYSSLEELTDYWNEQHNLQESLLSQHLLKMIFECLLPFLKSNHLQQRERLMIYRTLGGFLHHNGKNFPTLIDS